ncbi:hypothetical protein [Amycolatopsis tolypomycina]|nr:hypothetical protein [Amycolatopsis tolypomycina]
MRRPKWMVGQGATVAGTVLQVVALALAPVSIVQPVLAGGLVVALAVRSVRDRCLPSRLDATGAVLTCGGLAVFLVAARRAPATTCHGGSRSSPRCSWRWAWSQCAAASAAARGAHWRAARRRAWWRC